MSRFGEDVDILPVSHRMHRKAIRDLRDVANGAHLVYFAAMRYFHGLVFLGNCSPHDLELLNHLSRVQYLEKNPEACHSSSFFAVEALKLRLDTALSELGALQQGETDPACAQELEDAVRDLVAGLLGREVTFTTRLPYPPVPNNLEGADPDTLVRNIYRARLKTVSEIVPTPKIRSWYEEYAGP